MSATTVGFVGLGIMGLPMSKNLVEAGYDVVGYNRSQEPMDELTDSGGEQADSPQEVTE